MARTAQQLLAYNALKSGDSATALANSSTINRFPASSPSIGSTPVPSGGTQVATKTVMPDPYKDNPALSQAYQNSQSYSPASFTQALKQELQNRYNNKVGQKLRDDEGALRSKLFSSSADYYATSPEISSLDPAVQQQLLAQRQGGMLGQLSAIKSARDDYGQNMDSIVKDTGAVYNEDANRAQNLYTTLLGQDTQNKALSFQQQQAAAEAAYRNATLALQQKATNASISQQEYAREQDKIQNAHQATQDALSATSQAPRDPITGQVLPQYQSQIDSLWKTAGYDSNPIAASNPQTTASNFTLPDSAKGISAPSPKTFPGSSVIASTAHAAPTQQIMGSNGVPYTPGSGGGVSRTAKPIQTSASPIPADIKPIQGGFSFQGANYVSLKAAMDARQRAADQGYGQTSQQYLASLQKPQGAPAPQNVAMANALPSAPAPQVTAPAQQASLPPINMQVWNQIVNNSLPGTPGYVVASLIASGVPPDQIPDQITALAAKNNLPAGVTPYYAMAVLSQLYPGYNFSVPTGAEAAAASTQTADLAKQNTAVQTSYQLMLNSYHQPANSVSGTTDFVKHYLEIMNPGQNVSDAEVKSFLANEPGNSGWLNGVTRGITGGSALLNQQQKDEMKKQADTALQTLQGQLQTSVQQPSQLLNSQPSSGQFSVTDPTGSTHYFPTAAALAQFKQAAGL